MKKVFFSNLERISRDSIRSGSNESPSRPASWELKVVLKRLLFTSQVKTLYIHTVWFYWVIYIRSYIAKNLKDWISSPVDHRYSVAYNSLYVSTIVGLRTVGCIGLSKGC